MTTETNTGAEPIPEARKEAAEAQITEHQKEVDYDTKEYPVEIIVGKYTKDLKEDKNEIFVPDYQREFTWDERRQSKFIESVLIGLPIPYIFVADTTKDANEGDGRLEIVDGSQRIRTLAAFMGNELELCGLQKLTKLNGFRYQDLPLARQRKFNRRTIRMIELTSEATEEIRRDIFERINTGSDELTGMEKRRGILQGAMLRFLEECASNDNFKMLVPISTALAKRKEGEEYVLRFFAYLEGYKNFKHSVRDFLDEYLAAKNINMPDSKALQAEFHAMLAFIKLYFPNGFMKSTTHKRPSRIRFEAISVGTALALRSNPTIVPQSMEWIDSDEFAKLTTSDASNSAPRVVARIEFVRDNLLKQDTPTTKG
jgi:hypothetical protein